MRLFALALGIFSLLIPQNGGAQLALDSWKDHLPYKEINVLAASSKKVYAATNEGIFAYVLEDKSIERINKTNLLSDVGISTINYNEALNLLVVGYNNGNVDLVGNANSVNLSDIKRSGVTGSKRVNSIEFIGDRAFLACGFGIVVIDLPRQEISATYIIGPNATNDNILDIEVIDNDIWALSPTRLYRAELANPFLIDFQSWEQISPIGIEGEMTNLAYHSEEVVVVANTTGGNTLYTIGTDNFANAIGQFTDRDIRSMRTQNNRLILSIEDRVLTINGDFEIAGIYGYIKGYLMESNDAIFDAAGTIWSAEKNFGIIGVENTGEEVQVMPAGPLTASSRRLDAFNDNIWIAGGGPDAAWVPQYDKDGVSGIVNGSWFGLSGFEEGVNELALMNDFMDIAVNPLDNNIVLAGSWDEGLIELQNGQLKVIHNATNSTLGENAFAGSTLLMGISGVAYDNNGVAWITNTYNEEPLHSLDMQGSFTAYSFPEIDDSDLISDVYVTSQGYVWVILPRRGLLVVDTKNTPNDPSDDDHRLLTSEEGNGALPAVEVLCVEEDLDGEVWVGTLQGPTVFYNPSAIFESEEFDAQQIRIEQDGNVQLLLETETITSIEVDGANRKWFATRNAGVYLQSEDGQRLLAHYREDNSPLFSNEINDLAYNHGSGELYFATIDGVLSLVTDASNFVEEIEEISVYPNPVTPDFAGNVRLDGFAYDTDIKITDVSGNIVFRTTSNGGRAEWNGRSLTGDPIQTGIYLIFAAKNDGSTAEVGKIAIIR